jgi:hypothetical protein
MLRSIFAFALALAAPFAQAQQVGSAFTYQGELRAAGQPANAAYDFQFRLLNSAGGATQVGPTVTAAGVSVINGLFSVPLDFGPAQFAGDAQWLEISVRPATGGAFETLVPRTAVTPTPYALGAVAALANSVTGTSIVDGSVQAGDLATAAVGTAQVNPAQVQRRVTGTCAASQGMQSIAQDGTVVCGTFGSGTITGVTAGTGLSGGGTSGGVTLGIANGGVGTAQINPAQVQARVTGACAAGQYVRQVNQDGTVACGTDATGTAGWSLTGNAGTNPATNFIGTIDAQPFEIRANAVRGLRIEPSVAVASGGPITANVVAGSRVNSVASDAVGATIGGGGTADYFGQPSPNRVFANYGVVAGGTGGTAGTEGSAQASAGAAVLGGLGNSASGATSTVAGGIINLASGSDSVVAGGRENVASATSATIGGGRLNRAIANFSTIGGGQSNGAAANHASVAGGFGNCAGGVASYAGGTSALVRVGIGHGTSLLGACATANVSGDLDGDEGTFVWADATGVPLDSTGPNQFIVRAAGGVGINTNTPAAGSALTVAGPTSLGGQVDIATSGALSFGSQTRQMLNLWGPAAYGIGVQADTMYLRSGNNFAWFRDGSHSDATLAPGAGGSVLMTLTASPGTVATSGFARAQSFVSTSDRAVKTGFEAVDPLDVLARVVALPLSRWTYRNAPGQWHIGPVAQDFFAAFGLGGDDRTIAMVDGDGVALAAIQGLNARLEAENAALRADLDALRAEVRALAASRRR